jgi:hypothetical protein
MTILRIHLHTSVLVTLTTTMLLASACDVQDDGAALDTEAEALLDEPDGAVADELAAPARDPSEDPGVDHPELDLEAELHPAAYIGYTPWVSEEGAAITCNSNQIATGAGCSGPNCDSVALQCTSFDAKVFGTRTWSSFYSEEAPNQFICPGSGFITGMTCSGSTCDNLSVECTDSTVVRGGCGWTQGQYSEEQGWFYAGNWPTTQAIAGFRCFGNRCDNKQYYTCSAS